jgi:hypothetical protein
MHTVKYSTTRIELWRTYWRAWARPKGLWRIHVLLAGFVGFLFTATADINPNAANRFLQFFALAFVVLLVFLPLWTQLKFKSAVRTLTIDPDGWRTEIGVQSGSRSWRQVKRVELREDAVIITGTNENAMVIPNRAFESEGSRVAFYKAALAWHTAAIV